MENNRDEFDYSGLGVDADLVPFLGKEGVTLQEIRCYHNWRRGFDAADIGRFYGLCTKEAQSNICSIQQLIPPEILTSDTEVRDEILAIKSRSEERNQRFHESLTKSVDEYLVAGQDPISVLQEFREYIYEKPSNENQDRCAGDGNICSDGKEGVITEDPSQIRNLRRQNSQASIDESARDIAPEDENQLIAELRRANQQPETKIAKRSYIMRDPAPIQQNEPTKFDIGQKSGLKKKARTDRRVTVRLDPDLFEKVHRHCNDLGMDLSTLIRKAVALSLEGDADASKKSSNVVMPAEALARTGKYQIAGSDLKENLRESFLQLLAMSCVTERRWPQAMWIKELYRALLPLYRILEGENVRQP